MKQTTNQKLKELLDLNKQFATGDEHGETIVYSYELNELRKNALSRFIEKKNGVSVGSQYIKFDEDKSLTENEQQTLNNIISLFGDIPTYETYKDFQNLKGYIRLWFDDSSKDGTTIKDKTISKIRTYSLYCGLYSLIPAFYHFMENLKGRNLKDYSDIHKLLEPVKQDAYEKSGLLTIGDYTFNLFKNGRLDVTFKDKAQADLFLKNFAKFEQLEKEVSIKTQRRY